jgi:hypothetical protein
MMRVRSVSGLFLTPLLLPLITPMKRLSAQAAGTYVCTVRDASRQAGFVSQLFNVSQADAAKVGPAWIAAIKQYGVTPSTPALCQGFAKFTAADSMRKQFIAFVANSLEWRVDQMTWTYAGAPRATGDVPATAVSSPPATGANAGAQAEMSQAKGYCAQNHAGMYDCNGFAQAVHDHRVAHPDEWLTDVDGRRIVPIHDLELGIQYHLDCTKCLNDQMLTSWARERVRGNSSAAVISRVVTQSSVDARGECVAKAFVPKMHARPNVDDYLKNFNEAIAGCGSPH